LDKGGNVIVDEFQNTNVPGVYSVGDVQGKFLLTPGKVVSYSILLSHLISNMIQVNFYLFFQEAEESLFNGHANYVI